MFGVSFYVDLVPVLAGIVIIVNVFLAIKAVSMISVRKRAIDFFRSHQGTWVGWSQISRSTDISPSALTAMVAYLINENQLERRPNESLIEAYRKASETMVSLAIRMAREEINEGLAREAYELERETGWADYAPMSLMEFRWRGNGAGDAKAAVPSG